jgi:hypothetical protein
MESPHWRDQREYKDFRWTKKLSCQVDYLARFDKWEPGCIPIPYKIEGLSKSDLYLGTPSQQPEIHPITNAVYGREPAWDNSRVSKVFFDLETFYMPKDLGITRSVLPYTLQHERLYGNQNKITDTQDVVNTKPFSDQRLGLAVTIDDTGIVGCWDECQARNLAEYLLCFDEVVSFNGLRFDNKVMSRYLVEGEFDQLNQKTFDLYQWLSNSRGIRRRLTQWSASYTGRGNYAKSLIDAGYGYEEGGIVKGFDPKNNIPFILREGSMAQKGGMDRLF